MNLKLSLVNIFLSPIAVAVARQRARARKHQDFFYDGIAVYCAENQVQFLKEAIDEIISYFGDAWPDYRNTLKRIVLDDELQSILWVARRTTIIQESDTRRLGSVKHLAGALIADCERIRICQQNRCTCILWKKDVFAEARIGAEKKRADYLTQT